MTRKDCFFEEVERRNFDRKSIPLEHFVHDFQLFTSYTATKWWAEILGLVGRAAVVVAAAFVAAAAVVAELVVVAFYYWVQEKLELIWLLHLGRKRMFEVMLKKVLGNVTFSLFLTAFNLNESITR
jgi:hypothetical protein